MLYITLFNIFIFTTFSYSTEHIPIVKLETSETNGCFKYNSQDPTKCVLCRYGYGYNTTTNQCDICPKGYYSNGGNTPCYSCLDYGECANMNNEEKHTKCRYFTYKEGSSQCEYCGVGKHTNSLNTDCLDCPRHCLECSSGRKGGTCLQCEKGYGLVNGGKYGCEKCTGTNQYSDGHTECLSLRNNNMFLFNAQSQSYRHNQCGKHCEVCSLGKIGACTKCFDGYKLNITNWSCDPIDGKTDNDDGNSGNNDASKCIDDDGKVFVNNTCTECYKIASQCSTCHIVNGTNDEVQCDECYAPYVLDGQVCKPCQNEYHYEIDQTTRKGQCVKNLWGCVYQINSTCYDCERGFLLKPNGEKCFMYHYCDMINQKTCLSCKGGMTMTTTGECGEALNCKYSQDYNCMLCASGYHLTEDNRCEKFENCIGSNGEVCFYPNETYKIDFNKESDTFGKPIQCENNAVICMTPNTKDKEDERNQIDLYCEDNYYLEKNGLTCISKDFQDDKTYKCDKTNSSDCISCGDGYYLYNGKCNQVNAPNCFDQIDGYCDEERTDCEERQKINPDLSYCLKCDTSDGRKFFNGECLTNKEIGERMKCTNEFNGTHCICDEANGYVLDIGRCVKVPSACTTYGYADKKMS